MPRVWHEATTECLPLRGCTRAPTSICTPQDHPQICHVRSENTFLSTSRIVNQRRQAVMMCKNTSGRTKMQSRIFCFRAT